MNFSFLGIGGELLSQRECLLALWCAGRKIRVESHQFKRSSYARGDVRCRWVGNSPRLCNFLVAEQEPEPRFPVLFAQRHTVQLLAPLHFWAALTVPTAFIKSGYFHLSVSRKLWGLLSPFHHTTLGCPIREKTDAPQSIRNVYAH